MRDLMLIAGCFKFALMRGTRFRHRSAKLNSFQLETKPSSGWRRGWTLRERPPPLAILASASSE